MQHGKVVRVDRFGLGFIEGTGAQYAFTFDKVEGYRGQNPREVGLQVGSSVQFSVEDGLIQRVKIESAIPRE